MKEEKNGGFSSLWLRNFRFYPRCVPRGIQLHPGFTLGKLVGM